MQKASSPTASLLDWRVVGGVLCIHAGILASLQLSFDFLKKDIPLEITVEISADTQVIAGAEKAVRSQAIQPEKKLAKTKQEKSPETVENKKSSDALVERVQPNSSSTSVEPPASSPMTAGGMESAQRVRPDVSAKITKNPKPIYPKQAYENREEGTVILNVEVLESGKTGRIYLAKSSGVSALDVSAIEAVKLWEFSPARAGNQVVKQWVQIPVKFSLFREGVR